MRTTKRARMLTIMDKQLAQRVQARRIELGYDTQIEAAHAAGIGTTTWNLLESQGKVPKTPRPRRRIADLLGWPPDALEPGNVRSTARQPPQPAPDLASQVAELRDAQAKLSDHLDHQLGDVMAALTQLAQQVENRPRRRA